MGAMRLCIERILPPCRERAVKFALPPIESAADIAPAMKAVTSALAAGVITHETAVATAFVPHEIAGANIVSPLMAQPI